MVPDAANNYAYLGAELALSCGGDGPMLTMCQPTDSSKHVRTVRPAIPVSDRDSQKVAPEHFSIMQRHVASKSRVRWVSCSSRTICTEQLHRVARAVAGADVPVQLPPRPCLVRRLLLRRDPGFLQCTAPFT